jgi:hypothetical protein
MSRGGQLWRLKSSLGWGVFFAFLLLAVANFLPRPFGLTLSGDSLWLPQFLIGIGAGLLIGNQPYVTHKSTYALATGVLVALARTWWTCPTSRGEMLMGTSYTHEAQNWLAQPGHAHSSPKDLLEAFQFDSNLIWSPTSLGIRRLALSGMYIVSIGVLISVFVTLLGQPPARKPAGVELFYSYSHKDEELLKKLLEHLKALKRPDLIRDWYDGKILPGTNFEHDIRAHLDSADVILLLVSVDFLNSDYCTKKEVNPAMERHYAGKAVVIPIVVRPVFWETTVFGKLNALPTGAKPVTEWDNPEAAFANIAKGIQQAIEGLQAKRSSSRSTGLFSRFRYSPSRHAQSES